VSIHGTNYVGLKDGGLSVKIGGVERRDVVHGLEFDSTNQGDGAASFWMDPADPFSPRSQWTELKVGATIDVTHTLDAVTTQLYKGFIINDPRTGYAGEKKVLGIECGGVLEVARWRQDCGFVFTDSDPDQWFENKRNGKWASIDISDVIEIRAEDGTKVPRGPDDTPRAAMIGYLLYEGATYMKKPTGLMNGVKRIRGNITCNLKENMRARLAWSTDYTVERNPADSAYNEIHTWDAGTVLNGYPFDEPVGGVGDNPGYITLQLWTTNSKGQTVTADRFVSIDNVELYTSTNEKTVDEALLAIAQFIDLHDSELTSTVGSVLQSLVARPMTDPVSAMNTIAQQASVLVEWGWFSYYSAGSKFRFVARPLLTDPTSIQVLDNCYAIDATEPGTVWDVRQHPDEEGNYKALRFQYGRLGRSNYPAGFPDTVIRPKTPGWGQGSPFMGTTARVLAVDFSGHNYSVEAAGRNADRLARHLGTGLSSGTCQLKQLEVHRWDTPSEWRPVPYIRGGDWVWCEQSLCGPLYVVRSHVDVDSETVDLELGLGADALIEQLEAAGAIRTIKLAKHRRRGWRSKK